LARKATTAGAVPDDRLRAYLDNAPELVKFLMERTQAKFVALPEYADYYQNLPGSKPGGRSIEPLNFNAAALGEEFLSMREQNPQMLIMNRIFMTVFEARTLLTRAPGWIKLTMKLMGNYWFDIPWRFKSKRDRNLAMGNALVGMLRRSMMDRNIPLWLNTPARELVTENGRVVGVVAVGSDPGYVTLTPGDEYALVLNRRSGTMAFIRPAAVVPGRAREAALFTTIPVVPSTPPRTVTIH
jgi:3-oxosteroid 1-dehydrogenase